MFYAGCGHTAPEPRGVAAAIAARRVAGITAVVAVPSRLVTHWLPVARAMCDRLAALDGLVPPAAVARSTPSSPNAYRTVVGQQQQQQQLEKTASVPDLQKSRSQRDPGGDGSAAFYEQRAAPASACADSKSDGCLTDTCRAPVTSLSGTFLTPPKVSETSACLLLRVQYRYIPTHTHTYK